MTGGKATFYLKFDGYRVCPAELGQTARRRGINPLDRAKWILQARGAM
jgi:ribosomal protection tetracycline resistance protein